MPQDIFPSGFFCVRVTVRLYHFTYFFSYYNFILKYRDTDVLLHYSECLTDCPYMYAECIKKSTTQTVWGHQKGRIIDECKTIWRCMCNHLRLKILAKYGYICICILFMTQIYLHQKNKDNLTHELLFYWIISPLNSLPTCHVGILVKLQWLERHLDDSRLF